MKWLLTLVVSCAALRAQTAVEGITVRESEGPRPVAYQRLFFYTGTNLDYACYTRSTQIGPSGPQAISLTVSTASNANPVSLTATGHGLNSSSTPSVKITGATGNWAGLNGVWVATVTGANTFTVPFNSVSAGSFSGQTLTVTTYAPKTSASVWAIQKTVYDASGNPIFSGWASNPGGAAAVDLVGPTPQMNLVCDNRATYSYQ